MAWNEPGGNGKNPWDRGGGNDGPPDLDKIVRDWQRRFSSLLGGGKKDSGSSGTSNTSNTMLAGLLGLVLIGWCATGLYRVNEDERGVVLRFGAYQTTASPGLHWHIPRPIESVEKVNITQIIPFGQTTRMLTADENIVVVDLVVQFQRTDPVAFLFNVVNPEDTLSDVSESAIREVVGRNPVDFVLLEGRAQIAVETQDLIQEALDEYEVGIVVSKVNLQDTNFPGQVEAAVQDAIKAREDKERLSFEAESYANDILPRARGEAVRRTQDAQAYKARVIADSEGEASRFDQLRTEYEKAPGVTRDRLYIEAIEDVFSDSSKVLLDASGSGNLIYLPVDKLLEQRAGSSSSQSGGRSSGSANDGSGTSQQQQGESPRSRRTR